MLGIVIGIITEGLTGAGIIHQIGLGPLVDGYAMHPPCPSASIRRSSPPDDENGAIHVRIEWLLTRNC